MKRIQELDVGQEEKVIGEQNDMYFTLPASCSNLYVYP